MIAGEPSSVTAAHVPHANMLAAMRSEKTVILFLLMQRI
jgi:hypothetical protein